jgi:hypothetical protein
LDEKEGIKISAKNTTTKITGVSVKPLFVIVGRNDTTKWPFPIRYHLLGTGSLEIDRYQNLDPSLPSIDISIPSPASSIQLDISTDGPYSTVFAQYLNTSNLPSVGFLVGFSITAIQTGG